jgi:protein-S-isoprenylcysteine O-methyltransferase Ste14
VRRVPQLGRRGGGWVVIQFALIAAIVVAGLAGPDWPDSASTPFSVVGWALALCGVVVAVLSARALGRSLTPFPHPTGEATFVAHGPYRLVRHPIYFGGLLFVGGLSLVLSPWALAGTVVLGVVWAMKASVEERFLREHYEAYAGYCEQTRFRLVPFVY